jgi:3-hydroxyisobutyrate dehydrogenase-like beta-hydroxyacid dehydrogenase
METLRRKGFHVFVWNRTPRPVPNFVGAPEELAEMCDYLQIFVSDDEALLAVARQLSPGLGARHIVMAHSTVAPYSMSAAAEIIERRGARFVEAPFTGSREAAEKGELVYYVGGDEAALREARPILEASSKDIMEFGEVGQATAIKIATNMVTAASVQAAAEALALVQSIGLPPEKFAAAMRGNASSSTTLLMKLPKMIEGNFEPHFSVKHMLKDMQIASRLGLAHHLELGVSAAARDRLLEQLQRGHGEDDYSVVIRKYFPDVRPTSREEADLELFEPRVPAAPPPEAAFAPNNDQSNNVVQSFPESAEQPPSEEAAPAAPSLVPMGPPESEAEKAEQSHPEAAPLETASTLSSEEAEDEAQHNRGFLGRLLRR